jgi:hypothetical protein
LTACKIGGNAFGGDDFQVIVDVGDLDGDLLTVRATGRTTDTTDTVVPLTPTSQTVNGDGTATFQITIPQGTNVAVTVTVSDGRSGSASRSIQLGDDYSFLYDFCQTG